MVLTENTIHEVLTRPNPPLRLTSTSFSISVNSGWHAVIRDNVQPWDDFTYDNLMSGWGHLLALGDVEGKDMDEIPDSQLEIKNEKKVQAIAQSWNMVCLREAIKLGARELRGTAIPDVSFLNDGVELSSGRRENDLQPDMAVFLQDGNKTCIVLGDNKCSQSWTYAKFLDKGNNKKYLNPFRQVVTYGDCGKTRYCYIMSDAELVAVRVWSRSADPQPEDSDDNQMWNAECASIPWEAEGEGKLTVNLAIWWLAMMGLNDEHRAIKQRADMKPINFWWEEQDAQGRTLHFTHHLSRRRVDQLPAGASSQPRRRRLR